MPSEQRAGVCPRCRRYINPTSEVCVYCGCQVRGAESKPGNQAPPDQASPNYGAQLRRYAESGEAPPTPLTLVGYAVVVVVGLIFVGGIALSFGTFSKQYDKRKEAVAELKEGVKEELASVQKGKFADDKTVEKMVAAAEKYAENATLEERELIEKNVRLGKQYRKYIAEVNIKPETVHSQGDLRYSLKQAENAEGVLNELIALDPKDEDLKVEREILGIIKKQGYFFLGHWGKWSINGKGEIILNMPQSDVDKYNSDVELVHKLEKKQLELKKLDAKKQLNDLSND